MNLSLFTMPLHPPDREYVDVLKEDREAIILADQLGFREYIKISLKNLPITM